MNHKIFQLYCDHCHWKRITDGKDISDLHEIKTSALQGGIPKMDPETNKAVQPPMYKQKRKFRCPTCGYTITPRIIPDLQKNMDAKAEMEKKAEERRELERSIVNREFQTKESTNEKNRSNAGETGTEGRQV